MVMLDYDYVVSLHGLSWYTMINYYGGLLRFVHVTIGNHNV